MASVANINDVLEGHVALEIECVDRLSLNAYLPTLQLGGLAVRFLRDHLGFEIPSPSLLGKIGSRFRREVSAFARERGIPILHLRKPDRSRSDDRKLDHVRPQLERAEREGRLGGRDRRRSGVPVGSLRPRPSEKARRGSSFEYFKEDRRVGIYYFYILAPEFGPGFKGSVARTVARKSN
jgi:hypothetical protein